MDQFFSLAFNSIASLAYPSIFVLLLLITAWIFWKKPLGKWMLSIAILFFYLSSSGIIPNALAPWLIGSLSTITDNDILANNAVIVLGAGMSAYPTKNKPGIMSYARLMEAYRIYNIAHKHRIQYTIFLSGGSTGTGISEALAYKRQLQQLGVPEKYIITEDKSLNTYQNAHYLKNILQRYSFKKYILITSAIHMKRARQYFTFFDIKTIPAPSDFPYPKLSFFPASYNFILHSLLIHEYIGILRLEVYNLLGLNKQTQ